MKGFLGIMQQGSPNICKAHMQDALARTAPCALATSLVKLYKIGTFALFPRSVSQSSGPFTTDLIERYVLGFLCYVHIILSPASLGGQDIYRLLEEEHPSSNTRK